MRPEVVRRRALGALRAARAIPAVARAEALARRRPEAIAALAMIAAVFAMVMHWG